MKILFVNDDFAPESVGGAGKVVLDLSLAFKKLGHEAIVFTATQNKNNAGRSVYSGLTVIREYFEYKSKFWRSYLAVYNPTLVRKLTSVIKAEKPDVIHFHNIHSQISFAAIKAAKKCGVKKIFLTAHDVISFSYTRLYHFINPKDPTCRDDYNYRVPWRRMLSDAGKAYNPLRNILIRHYLGYCDKIFSVSEALKKSLNQNDIENVSVLYNGIKIEEFGIAAEDVVSIKNKLGLKNEKVIFFGGRGMSGKGADTLLAALKLVVAKHPDFVLIIASEHNKYENYLRNLVSDLGLMEKVIFPGLFSGEELTALFGAANVVVVPSTYFDPAPLMVMQAMAAGKPVVGTCFGGTPEVIEDGVTGFVVNPYDTNSMADRIVKILNDTALADHMGSAGRKRIMDRFDLNRQVEETLLYYSK